MRFGSVIKLTDFAIFACWLCERDWTFQNFDVKLTDKLKLLLVRVVLF